MELKPIGLIHSPFKNQAGTPIQPRFAEESVRGHVEVFEPYVEALDDLEGFERIWLLFHLDRARPWKPKVIPYRDTVERGLFSTRAPARPNPLGLSVVRLLSRQGSRLMIGGLDILDGTQLFDIKPYSPKFDAFPESQAGWLDRGQVTDQADKRFDED